MATADGSHNLFHAVWRKSSRSNGGEDACIEVARVNSDHAVRDSKDPHGAVLTFEDRAWRLFLAQVKDGSLDL